MKAGIGGIRGATLACALLLGGCAASTAVAAEPPDAAVADRAARLGYLEGDVRVAPAGATEWLDAQLNLTLAGGDRLMTGGDGLAELGWSRGALRIARDSEVELDRFADAQLAIWLQRGVAALQLRALDEGETVAITTEAGVINLLREGSYRVEADEPNGDTLVMVRAGLAELSRNGRYYRVHPGEMLRVHAGDPDDLRLSAAFPEDDFDRWCSEREERIARSATPQYVSPDVIGYEDLDAYGNWGYAAGYGYVWYPANLAPGWMPYAFGSWAWVGPWGWTWVDSAPWGFAPYHYGSWARYHGRWCWVPGPRYQRPRYAPAPEGWRQGQPTASGDGHWYRPPPPPREAPPRSQRPRDDRRVTIPERPLRTQRPPSVPAAPPLERPQSTQPYRQHQQPSTGREPARDRELPAERTLQRQGPAAAPSAAPQPSPARPVTPAPRSTPAPHWAPAPQAAPRSGPSPVTPAPAPAPRSAPPAQAPRPVQHAPAPAPAAAPPAHQVPSSSQPLPPPPRAPQQQAPQPTQSPPRTQHEDRGPAGADPYNRR